MKNNREQDTSNRKHKKVCSEIRATALRPRLHYYEEFHYPLRDLPQSDLTQRNYNLVYTRPSTQLYQLNPLQKR